MDIFSSIDVMNKAVDASLLRKELINQNISNSDTPGYKRVDADFESVLAKQVKLNGINELDIEKLKSKVYTDHQTSSYRMDGNNVDIQIERSEQAKVEMRYNALVTRMNAQLSRFKNVLQNMK